MSTSYRSGFVRFQQGLAREALLRGSLGAARMALRVLQTNDFAAGPAASEKFLVAVRNVHSTEDEILTAVRALIELRPAGGR